MKDDNSSLVLAGSTSAAHGTGACFQVYIYIIAHPRSRRASDCEVAGINLCGKEKDGEGQTFINSQFTVTVVPPPFFPGEYKSMWLYLKNENKGTYYLLDILRFHSDVLHQEP